MADRKSTSLTALALSALLLLTACGGPDDPQASDPDPTADITGAQTSGPEHSAPADPTGSLQPDPGPGGTASPDPAGSDDPDDPSPDPSAQPSQAETPALNITAAGTVATGLPVEDDWFSDAVFVGDSRTDGLMLYSGIRSASFISHQGLSVFNIGSKECIDLDGDKVTALTALAQERYAKVYLMLGINELGYSSSSYRDAYTELVGQIREAQPDATLYLQTLPPVNEPLAQSKGIDSSITNERVILFNSVISDIAAEQDAALVDVAAAFWTAAGDMAEQNTSDGVHLTRQGYVAWFDYLKRHTGTTTPTGEEPSVQPPPPEEPSSSDQPQTTDQPGPSDGPADTDQPDPSDPGWSEEQGADAG